MSSTESDQAARPEPDLLLQQLADYVLDSTIDSGEAWTTASQALIDSLGCALLALDYPSCKQRIQPIVPGVTLPGGSRVPGTDLELDPVQGAFCIGTMIRWLDFNDTWLAAEWGHPSDNLGAILALADFLDRKAIREKTPRILMHNVLDSMIRAYEIQGILALDHAFNRVGLDHVLLVRIASTAVASRLLGCNRTQIINAISNAFLDGGALRTYRHAPNTGPRKSWAAGDATSRAVRLALMARDGEPGYPSALTARTWGFQDSLFRGQAIRLSRPLGSYVMENILFKIAYPAEFHAQTAVEAAIQLHPRIKDRLQDIRTIQIETQESALRIINKVGPLDNPADRDHCLQYMVAIGLLHGQLTANHYEPPHCVDPRIDHLRDRMVVRENPRFTIDYLDPEKRSIANAIEIEFQDGSRTDRIEIEFPIGHRRRRIEGLPKLRDKFIANAGTRLTPVVVDQFLDWARNPGEFLDLGVDDVLARMMLIPE